MSRLMLCSERNELVRSHDLTPVSSITNYVAGEVVSHYLPPITATTWADSSGVEVLRDELDERGCRHFDLRDAEAGESR